MYRLLLSYINTSVCSWSLTFIIPLIILDVTGSALYVSLAYSVSILPYIIITPIAGAVGDSSNKKHVIQIGEILSAIIVLLIPLVDLTVDNIWYLLMLSFLSSCTSAVHHPIFQSIIPNLIEDEKIPKFNSFVHISDNIISISIPVVVGMFLLLGTKIDLIYIISFGYLLSFVLVSSIRYTPDKVIDKFSIKLIINSTKDGFCYVLSNNTIKYAAILFFGVNFGIRIFYANFVYHLSSDYSLSDSEISNYFSIIGLGSIIGAIFAAKLIGRFENGVIIIWSTILTAVMSLLVCFSSSAIETIILWSISSLCQSIIIVTFFTLRQREVPPELLGRTVAVTRMISYLAIPIASISGGWIMDNTQNFNNIALISGLVIFISAILCMSPLTKKQMKRVVD
ncbi:MFS transporter [Vibrio mangrovi]|uniref:Enterobactin exporter EntS n=1 Tax=Vibrio mangrovi TaxID=474394 RepID=A0A1Y6IV90_9VIBR|nr:MFS transporter [Vibrio mangrovi]MDW6002244.1 MFS transporter [Vibrio mangrovi]SMS01589.1 enterobactin exporter EntS [Vibrio mangrovi]